MGWMMAIPAAISIAQQFMQKGQQDKAQGDAMSAQMENLAFQRQLADRQYELATAARTNARGDTTRYIPGKGWTVENSADTASRLAADNKLNQLETERQFQQGEPTRNRNLRRQGDEAQAAEPLLEQFAQGWGLPTKAGVKGANTVANATAATEASDLTQNAANAAALRTGGRMPVSGNAKGAPGLRTALASSDLQGDELFQSMLKSAQGNKLDPYNMLATRAGGDVPKLTENLSGQLDSGLANAAAVGAMRGTPSGAGVNDASKGIAAQLMLGGNQPQVSYDALAGVLAKLGSGWFGGGKSMGPVFEDTTFSGRTATGNVYG